MNVVALLELTYHLLQLSSDDHDVFVSESYGVASDGFATNNLDVLEASRQGQRHSSPSLGHFPLNSRHLFPPGSSGEWGYHRRLRSE